MDQYSEPKQKHFIKKLLSPHSISEEFCEKICDNKNWPFIDYDYQPNDRPYLECDFQNVLYSEAVTRVVWWLVVFFMLMLADLNIENSTSGATMPHALNFIYLLFCPLIFMHSLINIATYWAPRTIIVSKSGRWYEFRKGEMLIHKGDLSDLYIRLEAERCTNGVTYYRLVLNGFMCEKHPLSRFTDKREVLDKIGRLICRRNNLNFFDAPDVRHVEEGTTRKTNRTTAMKKKRKLSSGSADGRRHSVMVDALEFF